MSIKSTIIENQLFNIDGQPYGGFSIVIQEDNEFGGTYNFTHLYSYIDAHDHIFGDDAINDEDGHVNT
jgi:hypothetical protein